jgi:hypothetical protein
MAMTGDKDPTANKRSITLRIQASPIHHSNWNFSQIPSPPRHAASQTF